MILAEISELYQNYFKFRTSSATSEGDDDPLFIAYRHAKCIAELNPEEDIYDEFANANLDLRSDMYVAYTDYTTVIYMDYPPINSEDALDDTLFDDYILFNVDYSLPANKEVSKALSKYGAVLSYTRFDLLDNSTVAFGFSNIEDETAFRDFIKNRYKSYATVCRNENGFLEVKLLIQFFFE